ncbi:hypothetical protein PRIPAC_78590 [Pristionchus pacificus]|uniref:Uncharacterized protein n=2 Tax=Pristionchus pacificus TaxID=54126 RepID=A0A2A6BHQ6_PRIPA|nr:hypothetical protein PRIPAC_78590 [Pristionchus pacificus]|eukprot:PDM65341.1 hypothetical protein PRIPAC_52283 [Pristionchus pacificus]
MQFSIILPFVVIALIDRQAEAMTAEEKAACVGGIMDRMKSETDKQIPEEFMRSSKIVQDAIAVIGNLTDEQKKKLITYFVEPCAGFKAFYNLQSY